mmetsp:Transcript_99038/g.283332  ORF Transcript_99038/g.283332 Transcript_99038/m.283332 type:complete len:172 (-) Transcript_99038:1113-1628(-)
MARYKFEFVERRHMMPRLADVIVPPFPAMMDSIQSARASASQSFSVSFAASVSLGGMVTGRAVDDCSVERGGDVDGDGVEVGDEEKGGDVEGDGAPESGDCEFERSGGFIPVQFPCRAGKLPTGADPVLDPGASKRENSSGCCWLLSNELDFCILGPTPSLSSAPSAEPCP